MALDREPIYTALLAAITSATTWGSPPSRRLRDQKKLGLAEQPTAFLIGGEQEVVDARRGYPAKWRIRALVVVYVRTDNPDVAPGSILNPIVSALELALEQSSGGDGFPAPNAPGCLGLPNVLKAGITRVELGEGIDSGQGAAMLDVEVLAFAS